MPDILVEVENQGFDTVTIEKASTGQPITTIAQGAPSKTFKLVNGSSVQITATSPLAATVALEGVEDGTQIHVNPGEESKELYDDDSVSIQPVTSTRLTLQAASIVMSGTASRGVKCGEVIIQPPEAV